MTAKQNQPLKVEAWPVEKIVPYARNPRKNEGVPVAKVKASLKEYGWRQPIVVDTEGVIIVGHTRYQAALELGMTEVPVHVAEGLSKAQVKAYRIADNKTGDFAEWDFEMLKLEFGDLEDLKFNLEDTGFDVGEMAMFFDDTVHDISAVDEFNEKFTIGISCDDLQEFDDIKKTLGIKSKKIEAKKLMELLS